MAASKRIEAIPASTEAVRRRIMSVVTSAQRETNVFLERYMGNVGSTHKWLDFISVLKKKASRSTDRINDFKDLEPLLQRCRSDSSLNGTKEVMELRRMVERGKMFDYISFSLRNDLVDAYENNLRKYCLSFSAETTEEDLRAVQAYDGKVDEWNRVIAQRLEDLDNELDEHDKYRSPLQVYISQYDAVLTLMQKVCETMQTVAEPMKRWVAHDSTYARRVQEEINSHNHRKMDLRDATKLLEYHRDQQGLRLKRRAMYTLKLERMLQEARDERRYYRRRAATVMENLQRAEAELNRKQNDIDEVRSRIHNRKENSPTMFNYLMGMAESLRDDVRKLERKIDQMTEQKSGLLKEIEKAQKLVDQISTEVETSQTAHANATKNLVKQEEDLKLVTAEISRMDKKILALKRIREIKLHSDTIKKIYHYGYHPGEITHHEALPQIASSHELTNAFKITSEELGKDWSWLYQKLPFLPPRDYRTRSRDIEVLDQSHRRVNGGFKLLTIKSLEKWRRLSSVASIEDLVSTLRQIKKKDTIKRIQKEILQNPDRRRPVTAAAKTITLKVGS